MIVLSTALQCAAVEGDGKDGLEIGCCCRSEGGTALLSAINSPQRGVCSVQKTTERVA